ncbi:Phosphatidic acid phosphatase type 2/haloperoxidase [Penicillium expansum]|uniref:Phosphatidic acid phosphatase type 2/haloperoxidase n=1 Tax=Penicillium expansum TaxID=27334 RepID=A0A0A2KNQ9_PENEN|nr:Phosphatidic acid phosphatase type 2/haloperoxidase [Penicillium expansum]KGO41590.1 Phosphatidic acid phosphatase type 2/haloperoxidase [Penicillium expansum]KGO60173.1 Phosphatidic acid phosphatase type 2/haloperoxidase [Penicillium expansum]KGO65980.1 Phosphatidic acid phosphatase type 2/haloperoxidase [Penicillium expansum]
MGNKKDQPDAGLKSLNHYSNRLPLWRYWPRQKLIPLIRYETPYLAWVQEKVRTPTLDSYFAFTANLGTHTFFMVFLPFLFWCGSPSMGRGLVHILASGVFWSGFLKDLLCLPRPLSPPLQRITMSGSAALEYGFPSTHSTNAVSVAVYALALLGSPDSTLSAQVTLLLQAITYIYVVSIVLGRLYCGMHGMLDCTVGCAMGAAIGLVQFHYGPAFEEFILSASLMEISLLGLVIIFLVRVHPEPADDCPCFDDSVAFAGVMLGVDVSSWHFADIWIGYPSGSIPYDLETVGWIKTVVRLVVGVLCVFAWRTVTKPALLRILPPIFRTLEKLGLLLPRRFFTTASEYTTIPYNLKDHDVLPNFSDIPDIITTMRHPRRRAISIGPQSEADAYETLAYREKRRRESQSGSNRPSPVAEDQLKPNGTPVRSRKTASLDDYEGMMGRGSPGSSAVDVNFDIPTTPFPSLDFEAGEREEKEVFSQIKKPRVRYDVEVVTKLVVYAGIPWVVIEVAPLLFDLIGLGTR